MPSRRAIMHFDFVRILQLWHALLSNWPTERECARRSKCQLPLQSARTLDLVAAVADDALTATISIYNGSQLPHRADPSSFVHFPASIIPAVLALLFDRANTSVCRSLWLYYHSLRLWHTTVHPHHSSRFADQPRLTQVRPSQFSSGSAVHIEQ